MSNVIDLYVEKLLAKMVVDDDQRTAIEREIRSHLEEAAGAAEAKGLTRDQAEGGPAGMHVILIDVLDPAGAVRPHYSAKLVARDGKATGEFVPAFNDPPGNWTIRATDFVTRATGTAPINLQP